MSPRYSSVFGRSTDVRINLKVNGHQFSVAQLGPDFLILRDAVDHPPCNADVEMFIDNDRKQWTIVLIDGISKSTEKTRYTPGEFIVEGSTLE